ncbi:MULTISPECIES: SufE family protein [Marinobacter]|jgi:cysteine desulfuration protein SufE|uniref:Cysteine desufuration protein SufE n=3 Tax=Marinobacter TaxID=2742 RepID=A0A455WIK1_MARNT|nr:MULTISPECIES: SufE family protein [Marinobacter]MDX5438838.1 SufE family protein [Alteromonadaceae bacterium]WBU40622.1 SufE family protein [Marinobacter alkaliphilus]BBJ05398.1 cysteine desufuration protein SufE [Marinobacter nauticus]AMQ88496.1 Fe-S metabolism protein SufE [Marinobacter sp. LQ44]KXO08111.1 Sulfur acceptor protein SufE for iron-sulfur cluster assembly [Marinobacter excellens LAMA 842]|eukprot:TRINITY_DN28509_c0_g1_i1.p1 TRINITY_DN28509_c0_g1~~TRINITY_DN28509_c0_g1_i1.p1  ORF type:complete len:153 (+),score=3.53 TRINITY_DN28509_c0_g1_i1:88-546(+)
MTASKEQFLDNPLGVKTTLEDVLDAFEFLDDWEERYAYIVDLGKQLPAFPDDERTEENYVHGCQSQVWLVHHHDEDSGKLFLLIDSDAIIVRGLAAIILVALNGKTPRELLATDIDELFEQLDLFRHISPTRGNGLRAMVGKIRDIAAAEAA